METSAKILTRPAFAAQLTHLKAQRARLVTTNGSFDLLHYGHVTMLQEAKALGDVLIVGVNSDLSVKRYKGQYRPICPQAQRGGMLAALACVDYVTIFDELTPIPLLALIQPHIHVNSPEHGANCVERAVVEQYGGRIHLARLVDGLSTSNLLHRILTTAQQESPRAVLLNPDDLHTIAPEQQLALLRGLEQLTFQVLFLDTGTRMRLPAVHAAYVPRDFQQVARLDALLAQHDLCLAKSVIISSAWPDIQTGRAINCKTIRSEAPTAISPAATEATAGRPHATVNDLWAALAYLQTA